MVSAHVSEETKRVRVIPVALRGPRVLAAPSEGKHENQLGQIALELPGPVGP